MSHEHDHAHDSTSPVSSASSTSPTDLTNQQTNKSNMEAPTKTYRRPPIKHNAVSEMTIEVDDDDDDNAGGLVGANHADASKTPEKQAMTTDDMQRHSISKKVRSIFELSEAENLVGEFPCYLVRLVTLPGWMYLTEYRICFYASLPNQQKAPRKSGYLSKKNYRASPRTFRYYFDLQNHVLSWYESAENRYHPIGSVNLKHVTQIRKSRTRSFGFKLITLDHRYSLTADSEVSQKEWMDELQRAVFMAKNAGNTVRIMLPFDKIINVEKPAVFDFAEYIKITIMDPDVMEAQTDDYFFAFFPDIHAAFKKIMSLWSAKRYTQELDTRCCDTQDPSACLQQLYMDGTLADTSSAISAILAGSMIASSAPVDDETGLPRTDPWKNVLDRTIYGTERNPSMYHTTNDEDHCHDHQRNDNDDTVDTSEKTPYRGNFPTAIPAQIYSSTEHATDAAKEQDAGTKSSASLQSTLSKIPRAVTGALSHVRRSSIQYDEGSSSGNKSAAPDHSPPNEVDVRRSSSVPDENKTSKKKNRRFRSGSLNSIKHFAFHPFHQLSHAWQPPSPDPQRESFSDDDEEKMRKRGRGAVVYPSQALDKPCHNNIPVIVEPEKKDHDADRQKPKASSWISNKFLDMFQQDYGLQLWSNNGAEKQTLTVDEEQERLALNEQLRKQFPMLSEMETVEAAFNVAFWRILPYYGKLYLTQNYVCFHSKVLAGRQKLIIPSSDVMHVRRLKSRGYQFLHGVGVTVKNMNEEIFFELSSIEVRDRCYAMLYLQMLKVWQNNHKQTPLSESNPTPLQLSEILESSTEHVIPPTGYNGPPLLSSLSSIETQPKYNPPSSPLVITCLTAGSRGDVQPYVALCKELQKDGHHCRIASHEEYKEWVESHGIEFRSIGGDPAELMKLCIDNGFLSMSFIRDGVKFFYDWLDTLLETAWAACQGTDVLIESPSALVGIHMAEKLEIPYFRSMPFPWSRTTRFPHPFAMQTYPGGRVYNDMTYVMIDMALWTGISKYVNRFRKNVLHLPATTLEKLELWKVPHIYSFSPTVVVPPKDWPDYIHCTGYWFLEQSEHTWEPEPELEAFLSADDDRPIIYIGFGSIIVPDPEEVSRTIVDAVQQANVRAIICKGWSSRLSKKPETKDPNVESSKILEGHSDQILNLNSVPHDWLFPRIRGVVHHGGAGTTAAGLKAGLPTIIKPFFGDQRFWGQRIEELGVGVCMPKLSVDKLTDALVTITENKTMIMKAKSVGETLAKENGLKTAVECIYRDLSFAKRTAQE
ncbi:uncharacterized protein BYT42DRAFT_610878 [Radiomyces spectabilis]|nr:uncharacterized protein BYT42DRAFT_610878 [Radiomyces spectabilis]KAI8391677.1 hypothetical protein BYT42DRAFT_610878 [Radiomyces spectabilis]